MGGMGDGKNVLWLQLTQTLCQQKQNYMRRGHDNSKKLYLFSEEINVRKTAPLRLERRNFSVVTRTTKNKETPETEDPMSISKTLPEEKLKYCVGLGNNSQLIRRIMLHRHNWVEFDDPKYMFVNFRWQQTNKGFRYENSLESKVFRQTLNHFQFHNELSNKQYLLLNLTDYCEHNKKNVFDYVPVTFILNMNDGSFDNNLNAFLKYFETNMPLTMKAHHRKLWLSLTKRRINGRYSSERKNVMFFCRANSPDVFYGFNSNYMWLLKPSFLNRGRGIHLFNDLATLEDLMNGYITGKQEVDTLEDINKSSELRARKSITPHPIVSRNSAFVVQKYLEKPMLINGRKFDIRVWVLWTQEMKLYFFKEGYLRTSSENYHANKDSLDNLYVHLTNNAVQNKHEAGNQLSFKFLQEMLTKYGYNYDLMIKNMKQIIVMTGQSVKKKINRLDRMNSFEIFGYDFMLDENSKLWLIEVNTNPCIEESSPLLVTLLPRMLDDAFKLTLDKLFPTREEKNSRYHVPYHDSSQNLWECIADLRK